MPPNFVCRNGTHVDLNQRAAQKPLKAPPIPLITNVITLYNDTYLRMNSKEKSSHDASKVAKFFTTDPIEIDRKVNEQIKHLLREYSHVPDNKTIEHVLNLVCINLLFEHSRIKGEERDFMGLEKESWRVRHHCRYHQWAYLHKGKPKVSH